MSHKNNILLFCCIMVAFSLPAKGDNIFKKASHFIKKFNAVDSNYIEPKKYDFKVGVTYVFGQENYNIYTENGVELNFRSHTSQKIGPSIGYKMFSGTLGLSLNAQDVQNKDKIELEASIFTLRFNLDLFYRKTGGDFILRDWEAPFVSSYTPEDCPRSFEMGGFVTSKMVGANFYYVFNHKKFSYPSAVRSVGVQLRSAGSVLAGIGYTHRFMTNQLSNFCNMMEWYYRGLPSEYNDFSSTNNDLCSKMKYDEFILWGGYAYNWVPARNVLISAAGILGPAIKTEKGDNKESWNRSIVQIDVSDTMVDFNYTGRLSAQYNNGKWFAGALANINHYRYRNGNISFHTDNTFWNVRLFTGLRF